MTSKTAQPFNTAIGQPQGEVSVTADCQGCVLSHAQDSKHTSTYTWLPVTAKGLALLKECGKMSGVWLLQRLEWRSKTLSLLSGKNMAAMSFRSSLDAWASVNCW